MPVQFSQPSDPNQDLRNHGDSPHHAVHTYASMADDVEQFIDEHGINRPIIIGHSMFVTYPDLLLSR